MVEHPAAYLWSSYRHHAMGERNEIIQDHPLYKALAIDGKRRCTAYAALFRIELDAETIRQVSGTDHGF